MSPRAIRRRPGAPPQSPGLEKNVDNTNVNASRSALHNRQPQFDRKPCRPKIDAGRFEVLKAFARHDQIEHRALCKLFNRGRAIPTDIVANLAGFFSILAAWSRAELPEPANDNGGGASSDNEGARHDR